VALDENSIRARIVEVARREMELPEDVAQGVAFHLTDWLDDLTAYQRFLEAPAALSDREVADALLAFLIHVPHHVAAAAKLCLGTSVSDVFGVGAVASYDGASDASPGQAGEAHEPGST
jgi:hypothetical protein